MTIYYLKDDNGNITEATAEIKLDKENFESYLDQGGQVTITPEQWEIIAEDIDGTLENSADEIMGRIASLIKAGVYFDPEEFGSCDSCGQAYELASRAGRCGDCGDCSKCCAHGGNVEGSFEGAQIGD